MKALVIHPATAHRADIVRRLEARGHDVRAVDGADEIEPADEPAALIVLGWTPDAPAVLRRLRRDDRTVVVLAPSRAHSELEQLLAAGAAAVWVEPLADEPLWAALTSAEYLAADRVRRERVLGALRQSAQRFRSLVQNALDIIAVLEPDGTIRYVSPAVRRMLDYDPHEFVGASIYDLVHPKDVAAAREAVREGSVPDQMSRVELRLRKKSGEWRTIEAVADNLVDYPSVRGIVVNGRDVTDRKQLELMLAQQAFYDRLTGLANRALFMDRVEHALSQLGRREGAPALLFVDLDGFKTINDSFGHEVGDAALVAVARRLLECKREGDTAARLGGDEFTVLLESIEQRHDAVRIAERILQSLRQPLQVDGHTLGVTVSIGIAYAEERQDAKELVRRADAAMYRAKELGKDRWVSWEPSQDSVWPKSRPPPEPTSGGTPGALP